MPGESSAVPTEDRVGLNHLETPPPTGPESVQHHPQEPVATVEAQATRRVPLANSKLVAKREDLRLQGSTGSKSGGYQSEKGDKRAHRGSHHDLTNGWNPCVFRSDGVFGNHNHPMTQQPVDRVMMSGSGPRWKPWNTYILLMSVYEALRQRIGALPEIVSREEVLKILDEYKPAKPEGGRVTGPLPNDLP